MRYAHTKEHSLELLRQAMPLMSRQDAALHPFSYALWYEHVSGENPALSERLESATAEGMRLDEDGARRLYEQFISDIDRASARRFLEKLQVVMEAISHSADDAGEDARRFGSTLEEWVGDLSPSARSLIDPAGLERVLAGAQQVAGTLKSLHSRLEETRGEVEELRGEVRRAWKDAMTDPLTQVANRRAFDQALAEMLREPAGPDLPPTSLIMVDIDHFKKINDSYGHIFGDKVLRVVAQTLSRQTKGLDLVARYGGEEFALLLPQTDEAGARSLANQLREAIEQGAIHRPGDTSPLGRITVSLGIAVLRPGDTAEEFVARADRALYRSKQDGRNRVTMAEAA